MQLISFLTHSTPLTRCDEFGQLTSETICVFLFHWDGKPDKS